MNEQLNALKFSLLDKGVEYHGSEIERFVENWMPQKNQDFQQIYFLIDLKTVIDTLINNKQHE